MNLVVVSNDVGSREREGESVNVEEGKQSELGDEEKEKEDRGRRKQRHK